MAHRYNRMLAERPVVTNCVTAGLLGLTGDAVCQFAIEGKTVDTFDSRRMLSMTMFNALYSRVNGKLFDLYPKLLPQVARATPLREGISSSLMDNCMHSPLLYLPAFFTFSGAFEGKSVAQSMDDLQEQFKPIMKSLLLMWIPINTFTFAYVPRKQRVAFVCAANLVWNCVLDYMHHGDAHASVVASETESETAAQLFLNVEDLARAAAATLSIVAALAAQLANPVQAGHEFVGVVALL